jgi:hypothetical protein
MNFQLHARTYFFAQGIFQTSPKLQELNASFKAFYVN